MTLVDNVKIEFKNGSVITIPSNVDGKNRRGNRSKIISFCCNKCGNIYNFDQVTHLDNGLILCKTCVGDLLKK